MSTVRKICDCENKFEAELKQLKRDNFQLRSNNAKFKGVVNNLTARCSQQEQEINKKEQENLNKIVEVGIQNKKVKELQTVITTTVKEKTKLKEDNDTLRKKYDKAKRENERLQQKIEKASISKAENRKIGELEEIIRLKSKKLKEKSAQVKELEEQLKIEHAKWEDANYLKLQADLKAQRKKCSALSSDLLEAQNCLKNTSSELEKAQATIEKKNSEILEYFMLLSSQFKLGKENATKVESLKKSLEELGDMLSSQQSVISQQSEYINEMESRLEMVEMLSDVLEANKDLLERCRDAESRVSSQENQLKKAQDSITHHKKIMEENASLKASIEEAHKNHENFMQNFARKKEACIAILKMQCDNMLDGVKEVKVCSDIPQIESILIQNPLSESNIRDNQNMQDSLGHPPTPPPLVSETLPPLQFSRRIPPAAPPPPLMSTIPLPNIPSPPPSLQNSPPTEPQLGNPPLNSVTTNDSSDNVDQLLNELIYIDPPSTPSNSKGAYRRHGKSFRKITQHGGNLRRYLPPGRPTPAKYYCACGVRFSNRASLEAHMREVCQERNFRCTFCPRKFHEFGRLKQHERDVHQMPAGLQRFVGGCRFCGALYESREKRNEHVCPKLIRDSFQSMNEAPMEIQEAGRQDSFETFPQKSYVYPPPCTVVAAETDKDIDIIEWTDSPNQSGSSFNGNFSIRSQPRVTAAATNQHFSRSETSTTQDNSSLLNFHGPDLFYEQR